MATKPAAAKKATPKKAAPKKTAPAQKVAPPKKTAPAKKAAPVKKAEPAKAPAATTRVATLVPPAAKPTRPGKLAVKADEKPWTAKELAQVRTELHTDRDRLRSELNLAEEELAGLMRDAGDGAGHDQADMGATSFERDQELTVVNNEREKLAQIDRALARIADGTYGICESCGNPIGKGRAMAFPRATLCLTCKQREERR